MTRLHGSHEAPSSRKPKRDKTSLLHPENFDAACKQIHRHAMQRREALAQATQRRLTIPSSAYHFTDQDVLVQAGTGRPVAPLSAFPQLMRARNYLATLAGRVA